MNGNSGRLVRHGMNNRVYKVPGREEGQGRQVSGKETEEEKERKKRPMEWPWWRTDKDLTYGRRKLWVAQLGKSLRTQVTELGSFCSQSYRTLSHFTDGTAKAQGFNMACLRLSSPHGPVLQVGRWTLGSCPNPLLPRKGACGDGRHASSASSPSSLPCCATHL